MKDYVKYFYITAILLFPGVLAAQGTDPTIAERRAREQKKKIILDLSSQARNVIDNIEKNYEMLVNLERVNGQGQTHVNMTSEVQKNPLTREVSIYTEKAFIQWQDKKIQGLLFDTRNGSGSTSYVIKKTLGMAAPGQHKEDGNASAGALNLVYNVRESLNSGNKEYQEFRFSDVYRPPFKEKLAADGILTEFEIFTIVDEERKIDIIREFIRLLRVLELRVAKTVSSVYESQRSEMERLINK